MQSTEAPEVAFARRLRQLRLRHFPDRRITQDELARALKVSVPSISSWESERQPTQPTEQRLRDYALLFATPRSAGNGGVRLPRLAELNPDERAEYDRLLAELLDLREQAVGSHQRPRAEVPPPLGNAPKGLLWDFPPDQDIIIVVAQLPERLWPKNSLVDKDGPDYVEMYTYADLDSLFELHGHIRAACPGNNVFVRTAAEVKPDDTSAHLVLLGGVDWNQLAYRVFSTLDLPVVQVDRPEFSDAGGFQVERDGRSQLLSPVLQDDNGKQELVQDVALFYRGRNPYNRKRTVTIFNGMYSRGTYGAVRALTDVRFRDRNEQYVVDRLSEHGALSIVMRVRMVNDQAGTPDWTDPDVRLHEWPEDH